MGFDDALHYGEDHLTVKESGVFTWDLESNVLHADGAVAKLFGLDAELVVRGLPIQTFIERIHSSDRPRVAEAIHHAVLTGDPYHMEYRVLGEGDLESEVMAIGRCFRNKDGIPSQYAGIVFPVVERSVEGDPVLAHVALAHRHAVEEGREIADALKAILEDLSRNQDLLSGLKRH